MAISRSGDQSSDTRDTEASASMSSRRYSAASRRASTDSSSDDNATVIAGTCTKGMPISGRSASGGGNLSIRSIAVRTSSSTSSVSANASSDNVTVPTLDDASETTLRTPASPTTRSSMRRVMLSSTSAGLDPG